jgi:hypothetical protein
MADSDLFLRRLERTAVAVCLTMAAVALVLSGGRPGPALAVLAGGFLIGVSYWSIGLGVHALASAFIATGEEPPSRPRRMGWTLARVLLRYALLALLAYVMIARLRLHPIGLLAGASSVVAAAALEACRFLWKSKRAAS